MRSFITVGLLSAAMLPLSALACAHYRAELTKDGDPNEPSVSLARVDWEDDCNIFCGTQGLYIESTSDNEWEIPCQTPEVILVVKDRGYTVEYRRQGSNGDQPHEGDFNFSFRTQSLTPTPTGGKYFEHNPYCPPPNSEGFLVAGLPTAWTGWNITQFCTAPASKRSLPLPLGLGRKDRA